MTLPVIGFAGLTHLGINSAAAAAARGFSTVWFDPDAALVSRLSAGKLPVVEPGLDELVSVSRDRIRLSAEARALGDCAVVYIACDVPTNDRGESDVAPIRELIDSVIPCLAGDAVLVVLCQVPPGFTRGLRWPHGRLYYQVETLVFGRAVERAMRPERFIVGCADPARPLPAPYRAALEAYGCPILTMRYESAELAKIAINCCLVASVTVANTLADLGERIGADWSEIAPALKLDRRIGQHAYLSPGLGLAGGNLERDLATVLRLAGETGAEAGLIGSFVANSRYRKDWPLRVLHREVLARIADPVIAVLGLAYKENTHSTKNSPALALVRHLEPWRLRLHDPAVAADSAQHPKAEGCATPLDAAKGADVLVIMTPWPAFRELRPSDLARAMRGRTIVDPYRVLEPAAARAAGFDYFTLGVPALRAGESPVLEHVNAAPEKPKRVVIIGAGGFVGDAIRKRLVADGIAHLPLTRAELDLLSGDAGARLTAVLRPDDSVVMVSALAPAKTTAMLMQNLRMAEAVCVALGDVPVAHVLYVSSDAVYADDANPVTESSYCAPSTLHGMMHAARELMLKSATAAPVAMLRPTLIYGAADPHSGYGPNRFRRQAEKSEPILIFGDGEERRDHDLVDDVAALAVLMLQHHSRGALNAVTGVSTSFHDIAHAIAAQFGKGASVKSQPRPGPRPHLLHRFFDITNCHKAFPRFRFTPLAEGLAASMNKGGK